MALREDATPGTLLVHDGEVLVVCGEASLLALEAVQLEGKTRVPAPDFARGARLAPGERFGV